MQSYLFLMVKHSVAHRFCIDEMFMYLQNFSLRINGLQANFGVNVLCVTETKLA